MSNKPQYYDELAELRRERDELREALECIERDVRSASDHCDDRSARGLFQFVQATARKALANTEKEAQ